MLLHNLYLELLSMTPAEREAFIAEYRATRKTALDAYFTAKLKKTTPKRAKAKTPKPALSAAEKALLKKMGLSVTQLTALKNVEEE